MADLTSSNVTVTLSRDKQDLVPESEKMFTLATVAFGNGTLTYPTGGVPLPAIGHFGLKIQAHAGVCMGASANGYLYKYDAANHKIRIYNGGTELTGASDAPAAASIDMLIIGV